MSFDSLGLSPKVLSAVAVSGYTAPTPIQAAAIPHVLARRDILGIAQTGTGKTASFVLPMLTILEKGRARARMPRTLILEPTRELAAQVEENFNRYGQNHKLNVALLIGGMSFDDQEKKLDRGVDVLIATPGRLLDHFERGKLLMTGVEILVIDEADRMLDMGFIPDIERIVKLIPFTRQTLLFSATMPPEIQHLADNFLSQPVRTEVSRPASTVKAVTQRFVAVGREAADKREALRRLIRGETEFKNAIVFCNRKRDVSIVARSLQRHGFNAGELHGDMDQRARMAMLDSFRNGSLAILCASDVAARGLDIPAVSHIINFDVPIHSEDYVHRIGRTGRAGLSGTAFTLAAPIDRKHVAAIEKVTGESAVWLDGEPIVAGAGGGDETEAPRPRRERGGRRSEPRRTGGENRRPAARTEEAGRIEESAPAIVEAAPALAPAEPEPQQPVPARQSREAVSMGGRSSRDSKPARPARERDRRDRGGDREPAVVGLGDHVPDFLLRPVRLPPVGTG